MQKRSSIKVRVLDTANEHHVKNPAAVALGRLGGLKGGKARAEKLSASKRKAIAKKAAQARWSAQVPE
jgi:hypothetical protein